MLTKNWRKIQRQVISKSFSNEAHAERILKKTCYYDIFEIEKNSPKTAVKKRYRDLTKTFHPDIWKDSRSHLVYSKILNAYTVLEDDKKRKIYDNFIQRNQKISTNFDEKWRQHQAYKTKKGEPYDYWNRTNPKNQADFSNSNRKKNSQERYWDRQAKSDRKYYARARRAGKRMSSQESEDTRKTMINIGWVILLGLGLYVIGAEAIYDALFKIKIDKKKGNEIERKKQEFLNETDKKRDTETTISNRIVELQKEMDRRKIRISIEEDTISVKKKQIETKAIKLMNKRMKKFNPKYKLVKSPKKRKQDRVISLRQYYETYSGGEGALKKKERFRETEDRVIVDQEFGQEEEELEGGYM